jgi:hypothetical protein
MTQPPTETRGPLADALVTLAGTPDDLPVIDTHLHRIVQLAADLVTPVAYASVTSYRGDGCTTVAASSELIIAVDEAQYAEEAGPCLDSLRGGKPVAVSEIATTMDWPGFSKAAVGLGLNSSVSIPLFAGSGTTIAALNLYGRSTTAMAPLIEKVWTIYDVDRPPSEATLDAGTEELLAGLADALSVRATIQLAVGAIMQRTASTAEVAYLKLRVHAAGKGIPLVDAARTLVSQGL